MSESLARTGVKRRDFLAFCGGLAGVFAAGTQLGGGEAHAAPVTAEQVRRSGAPSPPRLTITNADAPHIPYGENVRLSWTHDPLGAGQGGQLARQFRWSTNNGRSWTNIAKATSSSTTRDITSQPGSTMRIQARTYDKSNAASDWSEPVDAVCLSKGETSPAAGLGSGLWVSSAPKKVKAGAYPPGKLVAIAQALGLTRLFVWAQPTIGSTPGFLQDAQVLAWLTELRGLCDRAGVALDALFGDPWYCVPADAYTKNPFKRPLTQWALDCASSGLFDRLHLDNEPAGVNAHPELVGLGWTWPAKRHALLRGTLEGYQMVKEAAPALPLDVDIQYQVWDATSPDYASFTMADGSRFGDQVMKTCDGVAVMSYQSRTTGITAKAAPAIKAGNAAGVPVWSGINVDNEGNDPGSSLLVPGYTFARLQADMATVLAATPTSTGTAVHEGGQVIKLYDARR